VADPPLAPPDAGPEAAAREALAQRVRTPLLTLLTQEALERDYQLVAGRKAARAPEQAAVDAVGTAADTRARAWTLPGGLGVVTVLLLFGLLVTVAAVQTSRNADVDDASRATLIDRIETRRDRVQDLQQRISDLRDENADLEEVVLALGDDVNAIGTRVTELQVLTGFVPVSGGGIRVELDNAVAADPETEYLRDSDLALLVNGLWQAGAEAISINGQRLTALTAIRNVSIAIEVNSFGIAPPYTVLAIGDTDTLAADLALTASGQAFSTLADQYGWDFDVDNVEDMTLPAAPFDARLRSARELDDTPGREGEGTT